MPQKVILDVDPGRDDAVAIMLAHLHPEIDLLGITTVNGNRPIWECTENALRVVDLLEADTPVYEGTGLPLLTHLTPNRRPPIPRVEPSAVEGSLLAIPEASSKKQQQNAVQWLIDTIMASDGDIVLAPTGPLTNVALAIRQEPRIVGKLQEIIFMGGGHAMGNVTPSAEFNIWMDPESAKIVVNCGAESITMVGLDATYAGAITGDECRQMIASGAPAAKASGEFTLKRIEAAELKDVDAAPIHDALVVAAIIDRSVLRDVRFCHVDVETSMGPDDGRTVCDLRVSGAHGAMEPNVHVALGADRDKFAGILLEYLTRVNLPGISRGLYS